MNEEQDAGKTDNATSVSRPAPPLRVGKVLKLIVPAAIVLVGAFVFFGMLDGVKWLNDLIKPPLTSVSGQVFFNDEPLPGAEIATAPVKPGLRGAFGTTDQQGRFSLLTEVDGDFMEGAYAGEHRVTVIKRHDVITFGPAPALTPQQYTSFDTSPLRMTVAQGANVELRLEGEASEPPPAFEGASMRPPGAPPLVSEDAEAPPSEPRDNDRTNDEPSERDSGEGASAP